MKHKKFVALEAFSTSEFSLKFHKFYHPDLKDKIRKIGWAKFNMENRAWVMSLPKYYELLGQIRLLCKDYGIHI